MLLTKRVAGLVRLEKKVAFRLTSASRSFTSSKAARLSASWPKACTTFCPSIISLTRAVCSPRTALWRWK